MLKQCSNRKINDICLQFNLEQLINEPTHYTESSSSIIDLFLSSKKKDTILLSGVGEPFLEQNIRYHCPIYCVFNFNKTVTASYERHIWLYDRGITKLCLMILDKQIGMNLRVTMLTNMPKT